MSFANIPDSKLTPTISVLTGRMKADLKVRISKQLKQVGESVVKNCDNLEELNKLSNNISQISKKITSYKGSIEKLNISLIIPLTLVVRNLVIALAVLEALPIPNTTTSVGTVVKASGVRQKIKELIRQGSDDIQNITSLTGIGLSFLSFSNSGILKTIQSTEQQIQQIDTIIGQCKNSQTLPEDIDQILTFSETRQEAPSRTFYTSSRGETFSIDIITVDGTKIAPQRQAVAKDREGLTRFTSDASFSSSTDVLIKQVQFKIENNIS